MHKGNIMKFTEGAFGKWGYEVAKEKFGDKTITEQELAENTKAFQRENHYQRPDCGYDVSAGASTT